MSTLQYDDALQEIARYHSTNMATEGFFSHTSPDGETMSDRYDRFGYTCRVQVGENRYMSGAENIAYTYAGSVPDGENPNDAVAEQIVGMWMDSTGHRQNILTPEWQNEGIGVAIQEEDGATTVYATQNFC